MAILPLPTALSKLVLATAIPDYTGDANATGVLTVNGGTFDLARLNVTVNALAGTTATPLPLVNLQWRPTRYQYLDPQQYQRLIHLQRPDC